MLSSRKTLLLLERLSIRWHVNGQNQNETYETRLSSENILIQAR